MQVYSIDCLSEYYNFLYVRADNMCRFSIVWMRGVVYVCMHMVALTCIHIWRVYIIGHTPPFLINMCREISMFPVSDCNNK